MRRKVCRVTDISHEQWLEYRRTGIGGSDAATIVGLNPYSSMYTLYNDKLGLLPPKESTEAMRQGHDLEQYVADRWMEATGKTCRRNNFMWRAVGHSCMLADIDREVVGESAGLECKTTSVYNHADLENGEIPLTYYVQCQHYMAVMGFDRMYLAVLVLNRGFYHFVIERSPEEIAALVDAEEAFWQDHVLPKIPPPIDGSESTLDTLAQLHPAAQPEGVCPLSRGAAADLAAIEELTVQRKDLDEAIRAARSRVMAELGDLPAGRCEDWQVSWKPQTRTTIDAARLRREHPDIFAQYAKTTISRVFRQKHITTQNKED